MCFTGRLAPDFKTSALFRKGNGKAIRNVCHQSFMLVQRLELFAKALVAIDGSKFKPLNHRDRNLTDTKHERPMRGIKPITAPFLEAMDTVDCQVPAIAQSGQSGYGTRSQT